MTTGHRHLSPLHWGLISLIFLGDTIGDLMSFIGASIDSATS